MSQFNASRSLRGCSRLVMVGLLGLLSSGVARAEVVFGNLGASGTGALSATNTDFGGGAITDTVLSLAQGFTTSSGTSNKLVGSVTLGLFSNDIPSARTVSIYPDNGGKPAASPLYTSNPVDVTTTPWPSRAWPAAGSRCGGGKSGPDAHGPT